jgi:hypothetical protein
MRLRSLSVGCFPILALVLLASPADSSKPHPILAGDWLFSSELSHNRGQGYGGYGRPGGGGEPRGGGGEGGGFRGGFSQETLGGANRGVGELLRSKSHLTITQTDTLMTVTDDAGWIRELIPNGEKLREELGQGGPAVVETRWKGDKLIAERELDQGGTYQETYELNRKTDQLILTVSFRTPRMQREMSVARIYERQPPPL